MKTTQSSMTNTRELRSVSLLVAGFHTVSFHLQSKTPKKDKTPKSAGATAPTVNTNTSNTTNSSNSTASTPKSIDNKKPKPPDVSHTPPGSFSDNSHSNNSP